MATFSEAINAWTETINEWYTLGVDCDDVEKGFDLYKSERDSQDIPGEDPYIEIFFKDSDSEWSTHLDTVDREQLSYHAEHFRDIRLDAKEARMRAQQS